MYIYTHQIPRRLLINIYLIDIKRSCRMYAGKPSKSSKMITTGGDLYNINHTFQQSLVMQANSVVLQLACLLKFSVVLGEEMSV